MSKLFLSNHTKGVLSLIFLAFGLGVIAITTRYLSYYFSLFQQLYISFGIGFIFSIVIFPKSFGLRKLKSISTTDWKVMLIRVLVGNVFAAGLYRESLLLTKVSNVTFIQSVPFAGIFGWLLFKEKFTLKKLILLLIAYLGVILIAIKDYSSLTSIGLGEIYSFISAAFFSLSYVLRKWQSNYLNKQELTQLILLLGAISLFICSTIKGEQIPNLSINWVLLVSLFFSGFFNAVNIFLINYGFANVGAVLASNILTLELVFALFLALIFYQEFPSIKELIGGAIILGSVIEMNRIPEG